MTGSAVNIPPRFVPANPRVPLAHQAAELLQEQKQSWTRLAEGYASLNSVQTKDLHCDGFSARLQFNPGRMVSTAAKVDPQSIKARQCFLCVDHLPAEQKGILLGEKEFLLLCNPAPIFDGHFTISHILHKPQAIEESIGDFLELARSLGPDFTVFYNGPRCGASAPDHLHFQASPAGGIPVEIDGVDPSRRVEEALRGDVTISSLRHYGRTVFLLEGGEKESMEAALHALVAGMKRTLSTEEEPLLNLLASFNGSIWRLFLFPRSKHRPESYFFEDERKILVSPAAVDIGGLVITPREEDFIRLNAPGVEAIFREVSIDSRTSAAIIQTIR